MNVTVIPVTPFAQNCSIAACPRTRAAAVIDPGGDIELILAQLEAQQLKAEKILLTHGHLDHCAGAPALARRLSVPIEGPHRGDAYWLEALPMQARQFGFPAAAAFVPDRWLADGDTVQFGQQSMQVIHCPGHTPGHVVFFHAADRIAFVGDVLFAGSIGRTDFEGGNLDDLLASIRFKLWPLGPDVRFVPGHGPDSTFGRERRTNPFVGDACFARHAAAG
jgi:glyoxylase-like metal-dependent hydrolase (beta-lactamase superfamily II)